MFCLCELDGNRFIIFDKTEFKPEEFNLPNPKTVTLEEIKTEYKFVPIIELNDFLLRSIGSHYRTTSHKLGENNINSYYELLTENELISNKKSTKSKSIRELVQFRLNEINNL